MFKDFRYHTDADSGLPHIYQHNITEEEVEEVFRNRPLTGHSRVSEHSGNATRFAIGRTADGRHLKIIYVPDDNRIGVFIITAYDIRGKELRAFRRRMRRRQL